MGAFACDDDIPDDCLACSADEKNRKITAGKYVRCVYCDIYKRERAKNETTLPPQMAI